MGVILSAYTTESFREFLLPAESNIDHTIVLSHAVFGLSGDLNIFLDNLSGTWRICPCDGYSVFEGTEKSDSPLPLKEGDLYRIVTGEEEVISLLVTKMENPVVPYRRYMAEPGREIRIGRDPECDIVYSRLNLVAREHAVLCMSEAGAKIISRSRNGLYINSEFVRTERDLKFGDSINILGLRILYLGRYIALYAGETGVSIKEGILPAAASDIAEDRKNYPECPESADRSELYHRSPRTLLLPDTGTVEIEEPPEVQNREEAPLFYAVGPSFTMVLPMLFGSFMMMYASSRIGGRSGLFLYSGIVMAGTSAVVGVFWALMNRKRRRREAAEEEELRFETYSSYLLDKKEDILKRYRSNRDIMLKMYPSAPEVLTWGPASPCLWSINTDQEDFAVRRIGPGDIPFQVNIVVPKEKFRIRSDELAEKPAMIKKNFETLHRVPVFVDTFRYRQIGITGGNSLLKACMPARLLVLQTAANICYTDMKIVLLYDGDDPEMRKFWSFAKWLPHVWDEDRKNRYIVTGKNEAGDIFFELTSVFRRRLRTGGGNRAERKQIPGYLIIVADRRLVENEAIGAFIYDHAAECGLTTVFAAATPYDLPNSCELFVENSSSFTGMYSAEARNVHIHAEFDAVTAEECERFSRRISGLKVQHSRGTGKIPHSVSFLEMYGAARASDLKSEQRWLKNRTNENIRAMIGRKSGEVPMYLDIHEKYHGPHGLVAGMTGSGKSEALQTFILSLAVNYSPDDIAFFIIDYKGGGLANLFEGLPHLAGSISNLSGSSIHRAMVSIKSENRRRQQLFNRVQVNHIDAYTEMVKRGIYKEPVPHLLIVIDEFAELKKEEPDFMRELISVAQVGRSLGVHLILATQKPGGTVDENIRSNSRFRLCLRVQNRQDSLDMLGRPDAAELTSVGRCCFQVGNDEIFEHFQAAYSGAPYSENTGDKESSIRLLTLSGRPVTAAPAKRICEEKRKTELEKVTDYLIRTAETQGYRSSRLLWLPPLREVISLDELLSGEEEKRQAPCGTPDRGELIVPVGMADLPDEQAQKVLKIRFPEDGNIAVCGTVVSGKSTFLQTIIYSLISVYPPSRVIVYGIDYSGRSMQEFADAPHVGGTMHETDPEKTGRFFNMILSMAEKRKELFHGGNFQEYLRAGKEDVPAVFIVIDNYASFREKTADHYEAVIMQLSREGNRLGIFLILSAAGFGMSEIGNRLRENMRTVISLGMTDRFACAEIFHMVRTEVVPASGIRGRGLAMYEGKVREFQAAVAVSGADDYERTESIRALCRKLREKYKGEGAPGIPEIPSKPLFGTFVSDTRVADILKTPALLPVGYRSYDADIYALDLQKMFCFLVTGERRSGKTNFLRIAAECALLSGKRVIVIDSPERHLSPCADEENVCYASGEKEIFTCFSEKLTPLLEERSRQIKKNSASSQPERRKMPFEPVLLLIPDFEWLLTTAYRSERNMKGFLEMLFEKGAGYGIVVLAELPLEKKGGVQVLPAFRSFISGKAGIHFGGKTAGNTLLNFDHLDYRQQNKAQKPGVGLLPEITGEIVPGSIIVPHYAEIEK